MPAAPVLAPLVPSCASGISFHGVVVARNRNGVSLGLYAGRQPLQRWLFRLFDNRDVAAVR
jgi:hypothetical protein